MTYLAIKYQTILRKILKNGVNEHKHDVHKCKAGSITEKSHLSTY